jgi:hypothetical protein
MSTALGPIASKDPGAVVVSVPGFAMAVPRLIAAAGEYPAHQPRSSVKSAEGRS